MKENNESAVYSNYHKININYPCRWGYKVIGWDEALMRRAISEIMTTEACTICLSNKSTKGTYLSLNVDVTVFDEMHRIAICRKLQQHPDIKLVL